jgi:hypothetical protein
MGRENERETSVGVRGRGVAGIGTDFLERIGGHRFMQGRLIWGKVDKEHIEWEWNGEEVISDNRGDKL